ncbi:hypothetical protein [Rhizobium sp. BK602]|uniref:GCG_CRPN prefix-to-repeats domain-containing protein n=1 Tax=Rhizobium sp. BK602 TaxID=2586986 RepID=UPI00161FF276|nr:hypothetical protein [Rhizobium sp. BK602]MBB3612895.1 hypothetical protein [Rhizobium sp. BK602]
MKLSIFAIAAVLGGLAVSSAEAMPISAAGPIPAVGTAAAAPVVKVDYACGRGWHLTRWGECRPNRWGRPRGYGYGYYRPAPPPPPWGYYGRPHHRWHGDRWRDRRDW